MYKLFCVLVLQVTLFQDISSQVLQPRIIQIVQHAQQTPVKAVQQATQNPKAIDLSQILGQQNVKAKDLSQYFGQKNKKTIDVSQFTHAPLPKDKITAIVSALRKTPKHSTTKQNKNHSLAEMLRETAIQKLLAVSDINMEEKYKNVAFKKI